MSEYSASTTFNTRALLPSGPAIIPFTPGIYFIYDAGMNFALTISPISAAFLNPTNDPTTRLGNLGNLYPTPFSYTYSSSNPIIPGTNINWGTVQANSPAFSGVGQYYLSNTTTTIFGENSGTLAAVANPGDNTWLCITVDGRILVNTPNGIGALMNTGHQISISTDVQAIQTQYRWKVVKIPRIAGNGAGTMVTPYDLSLFPTFPTDPDPHSTGSQWKTYYNAGVGDQAGNCGGDPCVKNPDGTFSSGTSVCASTMQSDIHATGIPGGVPLCSRCSLRGRNGYCDQADQNMSAGGATCGQTACSMNWVNNPSDFERCAVADPSVLIDGKLNICKCGFSDFDETVGGCTWNGGAGRGPNGKPAIVGPFSSQVANTQSIMQFCSQHDSTKNKAFFEIAVDNRCNSWINSSLVNKELKTSAIQNYCLNHPENPICPAYCSGKCLNDDCSQQDDNRPLIQTPCYSSLQNFCKDSNLITSSCDKFCKYKDVNCDYEITNYCNTLDWTEQQLEPYRSLCGCFQSVTFYDNYFKQFQSKVFGPLMPTIPQCYYPLCSASQMQEFKDKQNGIHCPATQNCITIANIDNQGTIQGDITIKQNNVCNFSAKGDASSCSNSQTWNGTKNLCENCPTGLQSDNKRAICLPNTCPQNNQFMNTTSKNCEYCPDGQFPLPYTCAPCPADKYIPSKGGECISCPNGQRPNAKQNGCEITCPRGQVKDQNNQCVPCQGNTVESNGVCIACPGGQKASNDHTQCVDSSSSSANSNLIIVGKTVGIVYGVAILVFGALFLLKFILAKYSIFLEI